MLYPTDTQAQLKRLLARLKLGPADTLELRKDLDILSPAARILNLKKRGFSIETELVNVRGHRNIARYTLLQPATEEA